MAKAYEKIHFLGDVTPYSLLSTKLHGISIPRWKQSSHSPPREHQLPRKVTHTDRV